jgi:hypothetical protein
MHQSSLKGKWNDVPMAALDQSHLRMRLLLRTGQNIGQAPGASDSMDYMRYTNVYKINVHSLKTIPTNNPCDYHFELEVNPSLPHTS